MYKLEISNAAWKVFKKLPREVKQEFINRAQVLREEPLAGEPLKGKHRTFRSLHFSFQGVAYRIIYQVAEETKSVLIRLSDKRENIYRRLEEMGI